MAKITYLDEAPKITYLDDAQSPYEKLKSDPDTQLAGEIIADRAKRAPEAAIGGLKAGASVLSQIPSFVGGGLLGAMDPRHGGDLDKMAQQIKGYQEAIPYYKPEGTGFGDKDAETALQGLDRLRSYMGEVGGDQTSLQMTLNEAGFDLIGGSLPLIPAMRPRPRPGGDLIAEAKANATKQASVPESKITYLDQPQQLDMGFPREGTIPPDVPAMMERARELTFDEPLQRQVQEAGPQADMFNDRGGQFPGVERSAEMVRQQEAVPYEGLALADETPTQRPNVTPETMDFPLRQEVITRPEVQEIINSYRTEHARMLEEGASKSDIAQLENAFGEYMQKYGIKGPEDATGLRRPLYESHARQLPVEKTTRPDLGKPAEWGKHEPSVFELSDGPIQLSIDRSLSKQAGVFNPKVFVEGFNKAKIALSGAVKLMAFTNRDLSMLPEKIKDYVLQESGIAIKDYDGRATHLEYGRGGPAFHIVAVDPRTNKPFGIVEFRRKGDYLESDWVTVDPAYRGQGVAKELYTFARELGNDIRASSARTPEGRKMWEAYAKDTKLEVDSRPVLRRKEEGAIKFQRDPEFQKFKDELPDYWKKDAKQLYKKYKELTSDIPIKENEGTREALAEIPGVKKLLDEYTDNYKSLEELTPDFQKAPDIPGDIANKAVVYGVLSGGDFVGKVYNSPLVKWGAHKVRHAMRESGRRIHEALYSKETGLVPVWQELSKEHKVEWAKLTIENEGKISFTPEQLKGLGYSQKVIDFYGQVRRELDKAFEEANAVRTQQGQKPLTKRTGHFPGKFIGDFYFTVHKVNPETGMKEIIKLYPSNSVREITSIRDKVVKELEASGSSNYEVSKVLEKTRGHGKEGTSHAYSVYSELMNLVEANSPDAQVLQRLIENAQQESVKKTAGFFQHMKGKKGIEGSTGRNKYRDELSNADDMMRGLQGYIHQVYEFGEFSKIGKEYNQLLDKNKFPDKENTQQYLRWYFDQARGAESAFASLQNNLIDYVAHSMGVGGSVLRTGGSVVRSYLTWNLLSGWNAKFLLQQMIQPSQFLAQHMASLRAKGIEFTPSQMMSAWADGWLDGFKYRMGKGDNALRIDLDWGIKNHVFDQSIMHDLDNLITDKGVNLFSVLNGNHAIRVTEQFGRMQAFITFNKLLREQKGITRAQRLELASDLTTKMMTDYRPFEMPAIYQYLGPIGTAASALSRYKHNYFSQLIEFTADWVRSGYDAKKLGVLMTLLGVNQLMSGFMGMPGREDLDLFANIMKSFDLVDTNPTQFILQSNNPEWMTHGVMSIFGVDMAASLSAGSVLPKEHSLMPLISKGKKIVDAALEAGRVRTKATGLDFLKEALPVSAGGPVELLGREGEVVQGRGGEGELRRPIDPTDTAWIKRYLSMRDIKESKKRASIFESQKDEDRRKSRVEVLIQRAYADARKGVNVLHEYQDDMRKLKMLPMDLINGMQREHKKRMTTDSERFGGIPPSTPQQMRKYNELQKYRE